MPPWLRCAAIVTNRCWSTAWPSNSAPGSASASRHRMPADGSHMPRPLRLLVVADDGQTGRWLQHRIESLDAGHHAELDDHAAFERRLATTSAAGIDVLVAALDFGSDSRAASLEWIERV